jgi:hypothetical protein
MIWKDEIVEEVREARDKHAAKFDYDISAICADIRRKQAESGRKIVSRVNDDKEKAIRESDLLKAA